MYILGVDPGPLPGVVRLDLAYYNPTSRRLVNVTALQVTPGALVEVLHALAGDERAVIAMERFVVGLRAARSAHPRAGATTRDLIGEVSAWAGSDLTRRSLTTRSAAEVKPWATDARLNAAGLLEATKGMRHARDAGRHALFCAVKSFGLTDPLSKRGGT